LNWNNNNKTGEAGAAAELAASNKAVKPAGLSSQGEFVQTVVPRPNQEGCSSVLGRVGQLAIGGDDRGSILFQRISVVVQRFNSVLLHDGFIDDDRQ